MAQMPAILLRKGRLRLSCGARPVATGWIPEPSIGKNIVQAFSLAAAKSSQTGMIDAIPDRSSASLDSECVNAPTRLERTRPAVWKVRGHERFPAEGATWYAPQASGQLRNRLRHNPMPSLLIYQETFPSEAI
jgi:hypothetical protein